MAIIAKAGADYPLCPAGTHAAVCVDVVDLGICKSTYDGKERKERKIRFVWQIDEVDLQGKMFTANRRYTLSLHEKASLRKDLESWRGRPFSEDELRGFDVETVLGAGAMISVVHSAKDGKTFDNVSAVMRPPKGMSIPQPDDTYIRVINRPGAVAVGAVNEMDQGPAPEGWVPSDEDIPF